MPDWPFSSYCRQLRVAHIMKQPGGVIMDGVGDSRPGQRGESCVAGNHHRNVQGKKEAEQENIREWHHRAGLESLVNSSKYCENI
jgi:hypothetical protein